MEKIKINIIGSGIGGLYAGAILAKHGFEVNVFEARMQIGGYATSWKRGDFLFDSSLHEINGFFPDDKKLRTFRFLNLFEKIKLIKIPSIYTSVFKDFEFTVPHCFEEYVEELVKTFPHEEKGIRKIMETLKKISIEANAFLDEKSTFAAYKNTPVLYKNLMKNLFNTIHKVVWKNIKDIKLRTIIAQLYNYYSDDPKKMNFVYFASPTYAYLNESFWMSGTSSTFSNALKNVIEENGGKVLTGKKVTKVLFKRKKAAGLVVNDNEEYFSDITICNSSLKESVKNIIGYKNLPLLDRFQAARTVEGTSLFSIYIGMKIDVKDIGFIDYCYVLNEIDDLANVNNNGKMVFYDKRPITIVAYNLDNSLCPKGKTVVNICVTDRIEYWNQFENDKEEYKKEKERIANIIIDRVNNRFPGFKDNIEIMEIGTPVTMEKYTGNSGGAVYGACQRISQSNIFRFPNEIKSRNLYFSSAWVTPGGGLSGVIISAINVSEKILKKYKMENQMDKFKYPLPESSGNA
jgi:all-trans-retinol 13,14-reductase